MIQKIKKRWKSETPVFARILQLVLGAIAFIPGYYATLPEEFKTSFSQPEMKYVAIACIISAALLNLLETKKQR